MPSFTTIVAAIAGCSAMVNGAAVPNESGVKTTTLQRRAVAKGSDHLLSKREPVTVAILTAAGTAAATAIVNEAVNAAVAFIGDISNFDAGREAFTVQTTEAMMANNPDPERFQAAACYNKAFSVADPANIDGQSSVEFRLGILNTDYECMYIAAPNQFFTEGDGGLINSQLNELSRHGVRSRLRTSGIRGSDNIIYAENAPYMHSVSNNKIVPLTIIKGAGHEHIPIPEGECAIIADFHSIKSQSSHATPYLTTGFYRVVPGPTRYGEYDYEETKYVLKGQIDITDEATGKTHHLVAGDWAFFHVGSKAQFSTKTEGVAFYAVTRPMNDGHPNLVGREESTSKL
ncbi:ethanolamine utilization [Fusarium longipes]|uniref:Ethanolamine utilization n=1 Tax=Fusarium longipes TaxID=694270 RepID=A0A395SWQ2_9HYPO|nr:ethanolamine utilization [Fusarium longipes]